MNLVLDLDGTLVDSYDQPIGGREYDLRISLHNGDIYVYKRPDVDKFIEYCFLVFGKVGIFTAAQRDYAYTVISECFGKYLKELVFILTQEDCHFDVDQTTNKVTIRKLLKRVWLDSRLNIFTPENTLFIDDNQHVYLDNPNNVLLIAPFSCVDQNDNTLAHLMTFFNIYLDRISNPSILNNIYQDINKPFADN